MRTSTGVRRRRLIAAFAIGLMIIGGSFLLKQSTSEEGSDVVAVAQPQTTRNYIANTAEWREELNVATLRAAQDAPEIVMEGNGTEEQTVTGTFARSFFESFMRANAYGSLDDSTQNLLLHTSLSDLTNASKDTLLQTADIHVGESTDIYLREYGNTLVEIIQRYFSSESEDELLVLGRALQSNDPAEFAKLTNIADAYERVLADTLGVAAPPQLIEEHLALLNAYQAVGNDIKGMAEGHTDPVYALVRIQQYESDAQALLEALSRIYRKLYVAGIRYAHTEPGALFQVGEQ